ncbi:MAG: hypothetical protein QXR60_00505 [Candidatus Nanoarchaeia archaeon]
MYKDAFLKSFKNLRFSVFIPDLYLGIVELVLALLFVKFTGIANLLSNPYFLAANIENKIPLVSLFVSENTLTLLIYFALLVVTTFVLGASLNAMRYSMIRDIVLGNVYSLKQVLTSGVRFWPIIVVRFTIFILGIFTFLFLFGCYTILGSYFSQAITFSIITVMGIIAIFLLKLLFMFTYPIMFFHSKGAFKSIKGSFTYFFKNKWHVFIVFVIVLLFSSLLVPFELLFLRYNNMMGLFTFYTLLFLVFRNVASAFYTVWSELFIFYFYKSRELSP